MSERPLAECGAVILGGTARVGLEIARRLAAQGTRVILLGRNVERGEKACATVRSLVAGASVEHLVVDASRAEDVPLPRRAQLLGAIPLHEIRARLDEIILPPLYMMSAALLGADPFSAKMCEKADSLAHVGVAESEDLAAMALFLLGPAARRITGQAISINGGISVA